MATVATQMILFSNNDHIIRLSHLMVVVDHFSRLKATEPATQVHSSTVITSSELLTMHKTTNQSQMLNS